jgi:RNA polymerase sigma-70 factor (ECF subfamily)
MSAAATCYRLDGTAWSAPQRPAGERVVKAAHNPQHATDVAQMYRKHGAMVLRRIRRFYDADEAEEVLQEIFMRVLTTTAVFRGEASTVTWLYRLTTHHCLNRLRDARRRRELLEEYGTPTWGVGVASAGQEAKIFLDQLWQTVDNELLVIGTYHYVDGLTHAEIAELTGLGRRTIGNRLTTLTTLAKEAAALHPESQ